MARLLYLADLPDGATVESIDRADYDRGERQMPRIYDKAGARWLRCTRIVTLKKSNPSRHECDARCMGATGKTMNCECACGGRNHGKGALSGFALPV
jgi:hypothetical protein